MTVGGSAHGQRTLDLAMVIHNHQPVDNDPLIIEEVYRSSYGPFLATLEKFPLVKANLHYSGYLLEWLEKEHPETIEVLRRMISRGQVELVGGGYYEPILPCIPDEDAQGQIHLLHGKIRSLFGTDARGFWTAERAWEPQSPEVLQASGVGYTLLDDTIFMSSGIGGPGCLRPYLVESRGSSVIVFPMMKKLRYLIPWKSERATLAFLRSIAGLRPPGIAVFGDDGEKLGSWPSTYELVYGKRWLEKFFELLTESRGWLRSVTLSDYLAESPVHRRAYLPTGSYDEMLSWSLPTEPMDAETRRRAKGFWRTFLSKYPESGALYSRMLAVSKMVHAMGDDGQRKDDALRELWKGQFNDVYWHGVFGGLHSSVLRRIAYHHIIRAQVLAERSVHPGAEDWLSVREQDLDGDLVYIVDTGHLSVTLSPHMGGAVTELDFKAPGLNVLDVLSSRKEAAHEEMRAKKPKGRPLGRIVYDRYPRFSFQDFLVEPHTGMEDFRDQVFTEVAPLAGQRYNMVSEIDVKSVILNLSRTCELPGGGHVRVDKALRVDAREPEIECAYQLGQQGPTEGEGPDRLKFAVAVNISSLGDNEFIKRNAAASRHPSSKGRELEYPELGVSVSLAFDRELELFQLPIATVSRSEDGFRTNLQGVSLVAVSSLSSTSPSDLEVRLSCR